MDLLFSNWNQARIAAGSAGGSKLWRIRFNSVWLDGDSVGSPFDG